MIVLKHLSSGNVTIYPKGLIPDHSYEVGYESHKGTATRTGADLLANGIAVSNQVAGEMIYLGHAEPAWERHGQDSPHAAVAE